MRSVIPSWTLALALLVPAAWGAELDQRLRQHEERILQSHQAFQQVYRDVLALDLTAAESRLAAQGQLDQLPPEKAEVLRAAEPVAGYHDANLQAYFDTYDLWSVQRMDLKVHQVTQDLQQIRDDLATKTTASRLRTLDGKLAEVGEHAAEYQKYRDVGDGREGYKRLWALRRMSLASRASYVEIERLRRKVGDLPPLTIGERFKGFLGRVKRSFLNFRLQTSIVTPMLKILTHLSLGRGKRDKEAMAGLLREMGGKYLGRGKIDLEVRGADRIPEGKKLIFTPSHRSEFIDSMGLVHILPGRVTPIQTILFYPSWFRPIIQWLTRGEPGLILAQANGIDVIERCVQAVKDERTLLFFPEGNVPSPLGEIRRLRTGLLSISEKLLEENVAIVPVILDDPIDMWGDAVYGTADRELGIQVEVTYDEALDPRVLHALSRGRERLLLDVIRESWHRRLVPELKARVENPTGELESFSAETDGREAMFELLHDDGASGEDWMGGNVD